uniref:Holin n=1 Tax=viral metagenome TaxID=1070528 RepID=A0A6H1ZDR6_9ZZZZ
MDITQFAELGGLGASLVVLYLIVKMFINRIKEKDELFISRIKEKDELFTNIVSNHINHSTEVQQKFTDKLEENTKSNHELLNFLRSQNGKK